MKTKYCFFLLVMIGLTGCSGSSDEDDPIVEETDTFFFIINGDTLHSSFEPGAKKSEHMLQIGTDYYTGTDFSISFDKDGRFGKVSCTITDPVNFQLNHFKSYANYSSNYFDFELTSLDTINKRTKGNFSGYIYRNPLDLTSETKFVNGSFNLHYREYVPPIDKLTSEATINGTHWKYTNDYQTKPSSNSNIITIHTMDDASYKVMVTIDAHSQTGTQPGTYSFTPASTINKIQIAKFNLLTASYIFYDCTGTLNVSHDDIFFTQGTYNLTGVNPTDSNDIITVQNGKYKLHYNNN